jgi:hypothetical protein
MRCMFAFAWIILGLFASSVSAEPQSGFHVVSEETSEQRRSFAVRLEHRIDEATLMKIATTLKARAQREVAKTQVSFFLPGMPINQGSWANVLFSPDAKLVVSGLRLEDEELLQAEFKADTRSMLGSWLTSPPAPAGRLTIYSDHGRIFAEWRLRSGMKSVEELRDSHAGKARRFEMSGGGYYVLTKSGDIEIWDQTTLIAVGERMRHDAPAASAALAARAAPAGRSALGGASVAAPVAAIKQAEPVVQAPVVAAGDRALPAPPVASSIVAVPVEPKPSVAEVKDAPDQPVLREKVVKKSAVKTPVGSPLVKSKSRVVQTERAVGKPRAVAQSGPKSRGPQTTGDRISAQLTGGF